MAIDRFKDGIGLVTAVIPLIKQIIESLPDSSKKAEAAAALERAEREFKTAQAEAARKLRYLICRRHFPPEIMLEEEDRIWICPKCGNKREKTAKTHVPKIRRM